LQLLLLIRVALAARLLVATVTSTNKAQINCTDESQRTFPNRKFFFVVIDSFNDETGPTCASFVHEKIENYNEIEKFSRVIVLFTLFFLNYFHLLNELLLFFCC
jgi:hypothetical protein